VKLDSYSTLKEKELIPLLSNCISNGLIISVSFLVNLQPKEQKNARQFLLGRLIHQYIYPDTDYALFCENFPTATLKDFMDLIIEKYKLKTPTMIVLHVDETNISNTDFLERMDREAAEILYSSDIFLFLCRLV